MLILFSNNRKRERVLGIIAVMLKHEELFESINNIKPLPFTIEIQDIYWSEIRRLVPTILTLTRFLLNSFFVIYLSHV